MFIEDVDIKRPCEQRWSEMVGDDRVRLCKKCDKSVHNLSAMSEAEVRQFLASDSGRVCVALTKVQGNKVITDNTPSWLRPAQGKLRKTALAVLTGLNLSIIAANGQDIVSSPIDPRSFQAGLMSDSGYYSAQTYCHFFMSLAAFAVMIVPFRKRNLANPRLLALEQLARFIIPVVVLLIGTYYINNTGGLGGCPVGGIDTGSARKTNDDLNPDAKEFENDEKYRSANKLIASPI